MGQVVPARVALRETKASPEGMLRRSRDTGLCALKLTLHHAVGEGHDIALTRLRKLDDRPSDLLSAFVVIRWEPKNKRGGGKCLIHNFDVFGLESFSLQESDYLHKVVPELPEKDIWARSGASQPEASDGGGMHPK
jgi:hypothetical protein